MGDDAGAGAGEAIDDGVRHGRRPRCSVSQSVRRLWLAGGGWAFSTTMAAALEEVGFDQRVLLAEKTGWKLGGD